MWRGGVAATALIAILAMHPGRAVDGDEPQTAGWTPTPQQVRFTALGFEAIASDYYWLKAVQVVGQSETSPVEHADVLYELIEVATSLDPWVDHPYRFAALWMTDSAKNVRRGNRILERGVAYHPLEWRNSFYLSFNHFFFLGDTQSAAQELDRAIGLPGAPRYLGRLRARLESETGGLEVAEAYLKELVLEEDDGFRRAEYEKALDEIEMEKRARFLDQAREAYRTQNGRDIARVEDLVVGDGAVLLSLPEEPHGWEWVLNDEGVIVSSYLGRRYKLNLQASDRKRQREWGTSLEESSE